MSRGLYRRADDDGGSRVPRAPHAGGARRHSGCPEMSAVAGTWAERMNLAAFEPLHLERSWTLATYRTIGGHEVWEPLLPEKAPREQIIHAVQASRLGGRGRAAVPTRAKRSILPRNLPVRDEP